MPRFKVTPQTQKSYDDSDSSTGDEDDGEQQKTIEQPETPNLSALASTANLQMAVLLAQAAATMASMASGSTLPFPQTVQPLIAPLGLSFAAPTNPQAESVSAPESVLKTKKLASSSKEYLPVKSTVQPPRVPMGILISKSRPRVWNAQRPGTKKMTPIKDSKHVHETTQRTTAGSQSSVNQSNFKQSTTQKAFQGQNQLIPNKNTEPSVLQTAEDNKQSEPTTSLSFSHCNQPQKAQHSVSATTSKEVPMNEPKVLSPSKSVEVVEKPLPATTPVTKEIDPVETRQETRSPDSSLSNPEIKAESTDSSQCSQPKLKFADLPAVPRPPPIDLGQLPLPVPPKLRQPKPKPKKKRSRKAQEYVQCPLCSKVLRRCSFQEHMDIHNDTGRYVCPVCSKKFSRASAREKHLRIHTGEKPFQCPHCPKAYRQQVHLNEHMRSHTGERPFVCRLCGFPFTSSSQLARHLRSHGVDKRPVEVPELWFRSDAPKETLLSWAAEVGRALGQTDGKLDIKQPGKKSKSKSRSSVNNGTEVKTEFPVDLAARSRRCLCNICPAGFPTSQALRSHRQIAHGGDFPYKCTQCDEAFTSIKLRRAHYREQHPNICPFCTVVIPLERLDLLERHIKESHPNRPVPELPPAPPPPTDTLVEVPIRRLRSASKRALLTNDAIQLPKWRRFEPDKMVSDTSSEEESQSSTESSEDSEYVPEGSVVSSEELKSGTQGEEQMEQQNSSGVNEDNADESTTNQTNPLDDGNSLTDSGQKNAQLTERKQLPALFFFVQNIAPPTSPEFSETPTTKPSTPPATDTENANCFDNPSLIKSQTSPVVTENALLGASVDGPNSETARTTSQTVDSISGTAGDVCSSPLLDQPMAADEKTTSADSISSTEAPIEKEMESIKGPIPVKAIEIDRPNLDEEPYPSGSIHSSVEVPAIDADEIECPTICSDEPHHKDSSILVEEPSPISRIDNQISSSPCLTEKTDDNLAIGWSSADRNVHHPNDNNVDQPLSNGDDLIELSFDATEAIMKTLEPISIDPSDRTNSDLQALSTDELNTSNAVKLACSSVCSPTETEDNSCLANIQKSSPQHVQDVDLNTTVQKMDPLLSAVVDVLSEWDTSPLPGTLDEPTASEIDVIPMSYNTTDTDNSKRKNHLSPHLVNTDSQELPSERYQHENNETTSVTPYVPL